jgi:hypothetical protein
MIARHELVFVIDQPCFIFSAGTSSRCNFILVLGVAGGLRKLIE